jgi:hypothetical protein
MGNENTTFTLTASQRRLRLLVIVLGVLMVLGFFALLIGGIFKWTHREAPTAAPAPAAAPAAVPSPATPFRTDLTVGQGETVTGTDFKDGRIFIRLKTQGGEEIIMLDAATGRELGRIRLKPQP